MPILWLLTTEAGVCQYYTLEKLNIRLSGICKLPTQCDASSGLCVMAMVRNPRTQPVYYGNRNTQKNQYLWTCTWHLLVCDCGTNYLPIYPHPHVNFQLHRVGEKTEERAKDHHPWRLGSVCSAGNHMKIWCNTVLKRRFVTYGPLLKDGADENVWFGNSYFPRELFVL